MPIQEGENAPVIASNGGNGTEASLADLATLAGPHSSKAWTTPSVCELSAEEATAVRCDEGNAPEPGADDNAALRDVFTLLHECAARAERDGILVMTCIDPKTGKPLVRHFRIGDVDGMVSEGAIRGQFSNVYVTLAVLRENLPTGKRGTAEDIVAVLGLAIDDDGDVIGKRAGRPVGIPESVLIQTCSKPALNYQPWYLFTCPVSPEKGAELAKLIHRKCGGDYGTKDIDHVWRVPDTKNFPNKVKLARGRPEHPQSVQLVGGSLGVVDPDDLGRTLAAMADRHPSRGKANGHTQPHTGSVDCDEIMSRLPNWAKDLIATEKEAGQRSEHCFRVMQVLFEHELTDDEVRLVAEGAPFAAKYADRGDLDAEIARAWRRKKDEVV